jgi:uncharacterized repeat protein (TIGR03943 family)
VVAVSSENQGIAMAFMALLMLRLGLTDEHLLFVKPAMRPWLICAGAVLALLAVTTFFRKRPAEPTDRDTSGGHVHVPPRLAYLLALPFAAVFIVTPAPLGAFAVSRQAARTPPPPAQGGGAYAYPALLPPVNGAYEMGLTDFVSRALYDDRRQMRDKLIRLTGFVTPDPSGRGFHLTRFVLSCCAADGVPVSVAIRSPRRPAVDTWTVVEGRWVPHTPGTEPDMPVLAAEAVRPIAQPEDPYEG